MGRHVGVSFLLTTENGNELDDGGQPMKSSDSTQWQTTLTDWCIVLYPQIHDNFENPDNVFTKLNCDQPVVFLEI